MTYTCHKCKSVHTEENMVCYCAYCYSNDVSDLKEAIRELRKEIAAKLLKHIAKEASK